jgi:hypothetical protein
MSRHSCTASAFAITLLFALGACGGSDTAGSTDEAAQDQVSAAVTDAQVADKIETPPTDAGTTADTNAAVEPTDTATPATELTAEAAESSGADGTPPGSVDCDVVRPAVSKFSLAYTTIVLHGSQARMNEYSEGPNDQYSVAMLSAVVKDLRVLEPFDPKLKGTRPLAEVFDTAAAAGDLVAAQPQQAGPDLAKLYNGWTSLEWAGSLAAVKQAQEKAGCLR